MSNYMDVFDGRFTQRQGVQRAVRQLHDGGHSDQSIANAIDRDVKAGLVPGVGMRKVAPISRASINRLRNADEVELSNMRAHLISVVYAFLRQSHEYKTDLFEAAAPIRSSHHLAPMLDMIQRSIGATDGPLNNAKLKSLEGDFYLYRKAWTSPYADTYVRCVLSFEQVGEAMFYTETQKFFDTVEGLPTDEVDEGIVLPFGMNVVLIGRGTEKDLMKFFSFHDFTTYPDGHQHVHRMSGNFVAVYSKGPHPGFGAFARRVTEEDGAPTSAFYGPGELDEDTIARIKQASSGYGV